MFTVINLTNSQVKCKSVKVYDNETGEKIFSMKSAINIKYDLNRLDKHINMLVSMQAIKNLEFSDIIISIDGVLYHYVDSSLIERINQ